MFLSNLFKRIFNIEKNHNDFNIENINVNQFMVNTDNHINVNFTNFIGKINEINQNRDVLILNHSKDGKDELKPNPKIIFISTNPITNLNIIKDKIICIEGAIIGGFNNPHDYHIIIGNLTYKRLNHQNLRFKTKYGTYSGTFSNIHKINNELLEVDLIQNNNIIKLRFKKGFVNTFDQFYNHDSPQQKYQVKGTLKHNFIYVDWIDVLVEDDFI